MIRAILTGSAVALLFCGIFFFANYSVLARKEADPLMNLSQKSTLREVLKEWEGKKVSFGDGTDYTLIKVQSDYLVLTDSNFLPVHSINSIRIYTRKIGNELRSELIIMVRSNADWQSNIVKLLRALNPSERRRRY